MEKKISWADWLDSLPLQGKVSFTFAEAGRRASGGAQSTRQALRRARLEQRVAPIQRGLYAWIPPEYRNAGAPPFYWITHAWMSHLQIPYYVGLLSAAALLGASHQAPMEYQILVNRQLRSRKFGGARIVFVQRRPWPQEKLLLKKPAYQDSLFYSGPELTLVDLVKFSRHAAGWDNIATIARELGKISHARFLRMAIEGQATPILQRLGWLLKHLGFESLAQQVSTELANRNPNLIPLELGGTKEGRIDEQFQLLINYIPEVEE